MPELREHAGRHYAVQVHYALPDDSWAVELSEAVPAPDTWADVPGSPSHLPGPAFLVGLVPDEDPSLEPAIHVHSHDERVIPYDVMLWFMQKLADEVDRTQAALRNTRSHSQEPVED